ncbi:Na(+)-translocating NADH-quinone reductase subunit C [Ketobacter alkanivorans]|uniref:Na(+)-translocating NADH-quinone reductase subunit C n=1 Tax=Ketobacter alkanivorans TaxID=1917421 RepID=A0A2K9LQF5_9GAMM|nr:Na(+)-translocating NADH-quinone reductase subunit C [Ketobacter alkanivorans]AUM14589.1 Na(+)-translocating NADH-quinone reductase subunit C [Ketobacter alkanivorans]
MSSNDSTGKTLLVASLLCIVCSIIVSTAAVALKGEQVKNKLLDKNKNILAAAGMLEEGKSVQEVFEQRLEVKLVNLDTGEYLTEETATEEWQKAALKNPVAYDQRKAAKTKGKNEILDGAIDIASIKRQAKFATVYLAKDEAGNIETIILPVHGYGLWSTLYGFLALKTDANTVVGLGFYEHGETPGLGGEVDNPKWKSMWPGKQVFNAQGEVDIRLIKGSVDASSPKASHQIDGLAGATLTSNGVTNLIQFWLGENGFGPYLAKVKEQGV